MEEIFPYLWNDNPLDDVNYLLNRDVLLVKIPRMLENIGKPTDTKRDDMYQWTDVVFAAKSVYDSLPDAAKDAEDIMISPYPSAKALGNHRAAARGMENVMEAIRRIRSVRYVPQPYNSGRLLYE